MHAVNVADRYPVDSVGQRELALAWLPRLLNNWKGALLPPSRNRWLLLYRPGIGGAPTAFPFVLQVPSCLLDLPDAGQSYTVVLTDLKPPADLTADQVLRIRVDPRTWPMAA